MSNETSTATITPDHAPLVDATALVGAVVWVGFVLGGALGPIESLLALGLLVLVPLAVGLVETSTRDGEHTSPYRLATFLSPVAGPLAVASFLLDQGVVAGLLVLPWVGVVGLLALFGLWRLLPRGLRPVEELVVDAGLLYAVVGGGALLLHRLGVTPLGFGDTPVLLTAVHFHFAGFLLPVLTGIAGRVVMGKRGRCVVRRDNDWRAVTGDSGWCVASGGIERRVYQIVAIIVIFGPAIIAVGITFSPAVEVVAVAFFTMATAILSIIVIVAVVPALPRLRGVALAGSALAVAASMVFALGYGIGTYTDGAVLGLDIATMVRLHGRLNAFGFALLGVLAWRRAVPVARATPPGVPFSRLRARRYVGANFLDRVGARDPDRDATGMVDNLAVFDRAESAENAESVESIESTGDGGTERTFDADAVHPEVRALYEETADFELDVTPRVAPWFRPFASLWRLVGARIEQLNVRFDSGTPSDLDSVVFAVDECVDGRAGARTWTRMYGSGEAMYVATYATHADGERRYLDATFPLPGSNLSGILRVEHLSRGGLLLTTDRRVGGDEGIFLVTPFVPVRLPLSETLDLRPANGGGIADGYESSVVGRHEITVLGHRAVVLDYRIRRAEG